MYTYIYSPGYSVFVGIKSTRAAHAEYLKKKKFSERTDYITHGLCSFAFFHIFYASYISDIVMSINTVGRANRGVDARYTGYFWIFYTAFASSSSNSPFSYFSIGFPTIINFETRWCHQFSCYLFIAPDNGLYGK